MLHRDEEKNLKKALVRLRQEEIPHFVALKSVQLTSAVSV